MKTKYAAHLIMAVKVREGKQDVIPFYENVLLVYADSDDEAMTKACALGHQEETESADGQLNWGGRPARFEFVGVRKLIECQTSTGGGDGRLRHGSEVTYSQMAVRNEADLKKLADGQPVEVIYQE